MAPAVLFRDAVSLAGDFPVLAGLSLRVEEGETVLLHGANGAGKTSLLRACAGLLSLRSGEAEVLGYDLRHDREALRHEVGLVGHNSALYEDLTVEDNVVFSTRSAHRPTSAVRPALARLGLEGRLARTRFSRLSAGQRRRACLAALVARAPRLWLLDEPHAGLDAEARAVLDSLIVEARAQGTTVLFATHELEVGSALADRYFEIAGGVAAERTPGAAPGPIRTRGALGVA